MNPYLEDFLKIILNHTGGGLISDILSDTRGPKKAAAQRRVAMYFHYKYVTNNFTKTAAIFKRSRTTARYAYRQIEIAIQDPKISNQISIIGKALASRHLISTKI